MMKQVLIATLLWGALGALGAGSVAALEIVYPSDGVYVTRSDFLIIKGGNAPPLDAMTVMINGVRSDLIDIADTEYRAAFADFLILQPEWDKGKNQIVIDGYAGGKVVASATAGIYYVGSDAIATAPRGYKAFVMHTPDKEALCQPCHNMQPNMAQLRAETPEQNPCASCHKRLLDFPHVHGPAGVYQCVACHDPASRPSRYRLSKDPAQLCAECHFDKVEEYQKNKFVHGPVATGLCLLCHDPHASSHPAQLLAPVNTVCSGCHEAVVKSSSHVVRGVSGNGHPLSGASDPADPGNAFSCSSCHNPHGGQSQALFRFNLASRMQLCAKCHKK